MPPQRVWLDWKAPCLPAAASWLCDFGQSSDDVCRLDHAVCIMPGKRAGRVLLELLVRECESRAVHLLPPRIITPGSIVDVLTQPGDDALPPATDFESTLAWSAVLQNAPDHLLMPLLAKPPQHDDVLAWFELASTIRSLDEQLSGQQLQFTDAADHAERLELFSEGERWRALDKLLTQQRQHLQSRGLADRYDASATRTATTSITDVHVCLLGVVELSNHHRGVIQSLGDDRTTVLIHCDEALTDRFDELGCLRSDAWQHSTIDLDDQTIVVADKPNDQAHAALRAIANFAGRYAPQQITIGLGDASLSDSTEHAATWANLSVHGADGIKLPRTLPYRLLQAIANWLSTRRFADFAALLRHPDLEQHLKEQLSDSEDHEQGIDDWLGLMDRYFADHLQQRLSGTWLGQADRRERMKQIYAAVNELVAPLDSQAAQPLAQWAEAILHILRTVYGQREQMSFATREACLALRETILNHLAVHEQLQPSVSAATALRLTLRAATNASVADVVRSDQIEMLGWLELHLDPAPALVLMGVNDGSIPSAVNADAFLPDALRTRLGLTNNATRFARDAYLLQAIQQSRESLTIIAGKRDEDGEALAPSRLLLACQREHLPQRVMRLCELPPERWALPLGIPSPREQCAMTPLPPAQPLENPNAHSMTVTDFRAYLSCPYRYWLGRIERLKAIADTGEEMDPMKFGTVAHSALEAFGKDEDIRNSDDAETIATFLREAVDHQALSRFGKHPPPAVRVQLARLKVRLDAFAACQAQLRADGWEINACEYTLPEDAQIDIPDQQSIMIRGKIDRIDQHKVTKRWRLIDYKTGNSGASPFELHHGAKNYVEGHWEDLQLPLYRFLAAQQGYEGEIEVGYIVLPKSVEDVAFIPGNWTEEQFDEAIEKAREVVMNIRAGHFEVNPTFKSMHDDFATICRTNVLGGDDGDDDDDGGDA